MNQFEEYLSQNNRSERENNELHRWRCAVDENFNKMRATPDKTIQIKLTDNHKRTVWRLRVGLHRCVPFLQKKLRVSGLRDWANVLILIMSKLIRYIVWATYHRINELKNHYSVTRSPIVRIVSRQWLHR
jgi:hypothetical protein